MATIELDGSRSGTGPEEARGRGVESWHVTTALGVLAAGSLLLIGWIVAARPEGAWAALAACIQALATVLLVLVTTLFVDETGARAESTQRSVEALEESAAAMQRAAEASERSLSLRVHEKRVERLSCLRRLAERADRYGDRARRRTTDPSLPDDDVFPRDALHDLREWMLAVDERTARATAEAVDAADRVRELSGRLEDALGTERERLVRQDFAAANRRTADAFERVEEDARAEIERLQGELGLDGTGARGRDDGASGPSWPDPPSPS